MKSLTKIKDYQIVKSNKLIEARYSLSLQEQRVVLLFMSLTKSDDPAFKEYFLDVMEFCDLAGVKGKGYYSEIKTLTSRLQKKGFTIQEEDGDLQIGWVSSIKYYDKEGKVGLMFDPRLLPYLINLKKDYTKYKLINVIRLSSVYSIRLYEILKESEFKGSLAIDIEEIKDLIGAPKQYTYGNFKKWCLNEQIKEINEKTDLLVTVTEIKKGKQKVIGLEFTIHLNEENIAKHKKELLHDLPNDIIGLIPEEYQFIVIPIVFSYLQKNGAEYVKKAILYTNQANYKDYRKYLYTVLNKNLAKDWEPNQAQLFSRTGQEAQKRKQKDAEEHLKKERERAQREIQEQLVKQATELAKENMKNMSEEEMIEMREEVLQTVNAKHVKENQIEQLIFVHLRDTIMNELAEKLSNSIEI